MTAAAMQLMYPMACTALTEGTSPARVGNQGYSGSPAADLFETRDGWIALGANTPRQLLALLGVLDRRALADDPACFEPPLSAEGPAEFLRSKNLPVPSWLDGPRPPVPNVFEPVEGS